MTYIVIDGLDASGKSTQAYLLSKYLNSRGKKFCLRLHPSSDNFFGVKARQFLHSKGKSAHFASALFYMIDVIRSILLFNARKYGCVVYVRYLMGTAYLPSPLHLFGYHFFALFVPKSNMMFFLDVSPDEAYRRVRTRSELEMFEGLAELKKIRAKALSLALIGKWIVLDASRPINEVESEIRQHLVSI
jgi:dTMP kinase